MKKSILRWTSILALLALLANPALSFTGAKAGLLLWFDVVLPTLLPFMICSNVIVALGAVPLLIRPLKPVLSRLLKLSDSGCYVMVAGLLCGYPMGAKTTSDFMGEGRISKREGHYLLAIANHPSPMFLAGYVYSHISSDFSFLTVALSVYLPVVLISYIAGKYYRITGEDSPWYPTSGSKPSFDDLLMGSLEVMVKIGGYIMLFSILVIFANTFLEDGFFLKPLCLGLIEMTTGIQEISVNLSGVSQAAAIVAVTAFGGLSGIAQTKTVIKNAGLPIRHYVAWKGLHAVLSGMLFILLQVCPLLPLSR